MIGVTIVWEVLVLYLNFVVSIVSCVFQFLMQQKQKHEKEYNVLCKEAVALCSQLRAYRKCNRTCSVRL